MLDQIAEQLRAQPTTALKKAKRPVPESACDAAEEMPFAAAWLASAKWPIWL